MTKAIILGFVQGLTEFLPVSSSGHVAILEKLFGITEPVTLAVFLHFGTLVSIIVFFFGPIKDLVHGLFRGERDSLSYFGKIMVGTIPVVIGGALIRTWISSVFDNILLVAALLGITGVVVLLTGVVSKKQKPVDLLSAIVIGIGQMVAILPGISRSGMTISAGMYSGIDPEQAFRFSFLLSIPAILGANVLELRHVANVTDISVLITGMVCSFVSGLLALAVLRRIVYRRFHFFGVYCLIISVVLLFVLR
jgi:undecaprenyl-diphosphatase